MSRAHLIVGGYPAGSTAGHDMDFARRQILNMLEEQENTHTTVSSDFSNIEKWISGTDLLMTYVAGPYPDDVQCTALNEWLKDGGRWLALHGTSGGKAARIQGSSQRQMVKLTHHDSLGCFFLNHPPIRKFTVNVANKAHRLTQGLPDSFDVSDELYLIELQENCDVLLTTELVKDPSPEGFGFTYDKDTSLLPDGKTRALGYSKTVGQGEVVYVALGHCHSPQTNAQPVVDESVTDGGAPPRIFHGDWDEPTFAQLIKNGLAWGLAA